MNLVFAGLLAGLAAAPAWGVANLFVDFLFLPVMRRHTELLNEFLLSWPGLNLLILFLDIAFWGAVFGAGYGLLYPGLQRFGVWGGALWGLLAFLPFSQSMIQSSLWTKVAREMNLFWFVEGLVGLVAWGLALGYLFARFTS